MKTLIYNSVFLILFVGLFSSCMLNRETNNINKLTLPDKYKSETDTTTIASIQWRGYFQDKFLSALIDTALQNNQEINILNQEIEIAKNEVKVRKGEYLPFLNFSAGAGFEKPGDFTTAGALENQLKVKEEQNFPVPLQDYNFGAVASWEIDVWKKLRNAKKAAYLNFLASTEGRNFAITNLVSEIALTYYELLAYNNLLEVVQQNIAIQTNALNVIRLQKKAGIATQLAVNRFNAQLLNTTNLQYELKQNMVQLKNKLYVLTGKMPSTINFSKTNFLKIEVDSLNTAGIPPQLLMNRPDIKQAEYQLSAAKYSVLSARAQFLPSFGISAGVGFQSFNPKFLLSPESILYNLFGDIVAPLVNKNAIKAHYNMANAKQLQALYHYDQTLIVAYTDVLNQMAKIDNYRLSFEIKQQEVNILTKSIQIANNLFKAADADYLELLLVQEEALEQRLELIEIKLKQLKSKVNLYRSLGGGWQ